MLVAFLAALAALAIGGVTAEAGGAGRGGAGIGADTEGVGALGAKLRALSDGGDTALMGVAGSVLVERLKCDQVSAAPPISNAPAPSSANNTAFELRLRMGTASNREADRPATD